MPDDSTPDFKAAQGKHAEKLRIERVIQDVTGLPKNVVRARLAGLDATSRAAAEKRKAGQQAQGQSERTRVETSEVKMDAKPFRDIGGTEGVAGGGTIIVTGVFEGVVTTRRLRLG